MLRNTVFGVIVLLLGAALVWYVHETEEQLPVNVYYEKDDDIWVSDLFGEEERPLTEGRVVDPFIADGHTRRVSPSFSPDGLFAVVPNRPNGTTKVIDLDEGKVKVMKDRLLGVTAWSPDSRYLAHASWNDMNAMLALTVWDRETGDVQEIDVTGDYEMLGIRLIVWSPQGDKIAFACCFETGLDEDGVYDGSMHGEVRVVLFDDGQLGETAETMTQTLRTSFAGGSQSLCWNDDNEVEVSDKFDVDKNLVCARYPVHRVVASHEHKRAALGRADQDDMGWEGATIISVYDPSTKEIVWEKRVEQNVTHVVWSPDGSYLLLDDDWPNSPIWLIDSAGSEPMREIVESGFLLDAFVRDEDVAD